MWLLSKRGFYSVVQHRDDPDVLIVRARAAEDIEVLRRFVPNLEPFEDLTADYRWRAQVPREEWVETAAELVREIDYDNFKAAVFDLQGVDRHDIYAQAWRVLKQIA